MTDATPYRSELEAHLPRIRALVRSIAGRQGQHDDIVQECLAHLIAQEHLWEPREGRLAGWFNTLSRRVTYRYLSRERRRSDKEAAMPATEPTAPERSVDADQIRWVLEQYALLPDDLREVLHLRYHEALTVAEVGRRLGISQQATSKRLAKALDHLQRRARSAGLLSLLLPWHWPLVQNTGAPVKIAVTLLAASALASPFFLPSPDTDLVAETTALSRTSIVAAPDAPLDPARNALWCSSVQMCWNEFEALVGEPVRLQGEAPPPSLAWLNDSKLTKDHVDPRALVAGAGMLDSGVVARLQAELDEKFGQGRDPVLDQAAQAVSDLPNAWVAYAFLYKDLPFAKQFEAVPSIGFFGPRVEGAPAAGPTRVQMFGIREFEPQRAEMDELTKQVRVAQYRSPGEFVVRLLPQGKDEIILARVPPGATLRATWDDVRKRIAAGGETSLRSRDQLLVPKFDFDLKHSFDEFVGRTLANDGWEAQVCKLFFQNIRLRLDERGAELKSRATMAGGEKGERRRMVCNKAFLLAMKERDKAEPYLLMWVANDEVLVKAPAPEPETPSTK